MLADALGSCALQLWLTIVNTRLRYETESPAAGAFSCIKVCVTLAASRVSGRRWAGLAVYGRLQPPNLADYIRETQPTSEGAVVGLRDGA